MTRVQFYIIKSDNQDEQFSYAVQLALQVLARGKHLHIHTTSVAATREMLSLFNDKLSSGDDRLNIDHNGEPGTERDVLLNLSNEVPYFFSSFDSTLEIICSESQSAAMGRERYRYYQSRGYPLQHCDVPPQLVL